MQTQNRIFDDLARLAGGALGAVSGVREEIELLVRGRIERVLSEMDLVPRDEFDAVKAMAEKARIENEDLARRLAELEAKVSPGKPKAKASAAPATTRRRPARRTAAAAAAAAATPKSAPHPAADDETPDDKPEE